MIGRTERTPGSLLFNVGDCVGVVLMKLGPSDIRKNSLATVEPLMLWWIRGLPHIRQKKFSSRGPTRPSNMALLVVYTSHQVLGSATEERWRQPAWRAYPSKAEQCPRLPRNRCSQCLPRWLRCW